MPRRSPAPPSCPTGASCTAEAASSIGCRPRPSLSERPLLASPEAGSLERMFKVLASGTRLRLRHVLLRHPGTAVTELAQALGMTPQAVSNQLQRLADKGIVSGMRDGTSIHYRVVDPCVAELIDLCWCLAEDAHDRLDRLGAAAGSARSIAARRRDSTDPA